MSMYRIRVKEVYELDVDVPDYVEDVEGYLWSEYQDGEPEPVASEVLGITRLD